MEHHLSSNESPDHILRGFEPPSGQSSDESALSSILELLESAPEFNETHAKELAILCRNHVSVRAAVALSIHFARKATCELLNAPTWEQTCRLQGQAAGQERIYAALLTFMTEAEAPRMETQDALEDFEQAP